MLRPHPIVRMLSGALGVLAAFLTSDLWLLIAAVAAISTLVVIAGIGKRYASLCLRVFLPLAAGLLLVWGGVMGAPPGSPIGSNRIGGLMFATLVVLRLVVASGISQLCILAIPSHELPQVLSVCGIKGDLLASVVAAFVLVPELELRTQQVLTARYARGLSKNRNSWGLVAHIPMLLRPVLTWTLRSAVQRSELWSQRRLIERLEARSSGLQWSMAASILWLLPGCAWFVGAAAARFQH
jgi:energy-coupling factor transporter transmembrane protein EcfT